MVKISKLIASIFIFVLYLSLFDSNTAFASEPLSGKQLTSPCDGLAKLSKIDYGFPLPYISGKTERLKEKKVMTQTVPCQWYDMKIIFDNQGNFIFASKDNTVYFQSMYASFEIPGSGCKLCALSSEVGTISATGMLLIIDQEGRIHDELCCEIEGEGFSIRSFSIDENLNITIYSIVPDSTQSVSLWEYHVSFPGHRENTTYKIVNNHFVETDIVKGKSKTINQTDFKQGQWALWSSFWKI
ncbi:MAG: hypothetical protein MJY49_01390 [Bacteroidales bacterium]|nr:hypothetical protein [Bacteroidales bacterium]